MNLEKEKIPLVVLTGPTASGKTAVGVDLCLALGGEVVSADSMQIYDVLQVGTARPTEDEMRGIPHHLMGFLSPSKSFSVADYVREAHRTIREINNRGALPVVVGGTGLYISSLVDNVSFGEAEINTELRQNLEALADNEGNQALWEKLNEIDPEAASQLHPNNRWRVIRAIERNQATGLLMSQHQAESKKEPSPYELCMVGLCFRDRKNLYDRVNLRVTKMAKGGLLEEARWLMDSGYSTTCFQAIGYKELTSCLSGEEELEEACNRIRQGSRHYAKRQLTWFRRDSRITWFYVEDYPDYQALAQAVIDFVRSRL